jgi:predicted dehydrogenase
MNFAAEAEREGRAVSGTSIGVAVIGAGMAGRAHASGYRSAPAVFGAGLPDVRLVANRLHREIVCALLDAGKHVLCEKPLAPSVADGQAMVDRAGRAGRVAAVGFTFRRSPAISAIRQQLTEGGLGPAVHFSGHYWCDYGFRPDAPMSWRYQGGPGSGALADIGTHPLGTAVGHAGGVPVSEVREQVENEDLATFTATFAGG